MDQQCPGIQLDIPIEKKFQCVPRVATQCYMMKSSVVKRGTLALHSAQCTVTLCDTLNVSPSGRRTGTVNTVCHSMFEEQCVTLTLCHSKPCHTVSHTVSEEQYLTATLFNCVLVRPCKPGFSPSCLPCLSCLLSKHSSRASQTYSISGVNQFRELRD